MKQNNVITSASRRQMLKGATVAGAIGLLGGGLASGAAAAPSREKSGHDEPVKPVAANGAQGVGHYKFSIGDIKCVSLNDAGGKISPVQPTFAPDADPAELRAALEAAFVPTDHAPMYFNVTVLKIGDQTVVVDTGNGGSAAGMAANLAAAGIKPDSVNAVVISHAHPDHIFGLLGEKDTPVFPNARVFISRIEHDFWMADTIDFGDTAVPDEWKKAWAKRVPEVLKATKRSLQLVAGGDKLIDGLEVLHTPGHTPGHLSVLANSGADSAMLMGDLAHNHVIMFAQPGWTVGFDHDRKQAVKTRLAVFDRLAADRTRVLGYHLPWPGLGNIRRKDGNSFEWVIEGWRWEG